MTLTRKQKMMMKIKARLDTPPSRPGITMRGNCSLCQETGHNRVTCPKRKRYALDARLRLRMAG